MITFKYNLIFLDMENQYRLVIKFFVLKGLEGKEIHERMVKVLKESGPSFPTVHRSYLQFKCRRSSII